MENFNFSNFKNYFFKTFSKCVCDIFPRITPRHENWEGADSINKIATTAHTADAENKDSPDSAQQ